MTEQERYENMVDEIIDLKNKIKDLQAENERLEKEVAKEFTCFVGDPHKVEHCPYLEELEKAKAENERLKETIDSFTEIGKLYSEIKSEARKEFAERLCEDRVSNDPIVIATKCLLKEMESDDNG